MADSQAGPFFFVIGAYAAARWSATGRLVLRTETRRPSTAQSITFTFILPAKAVWEKMHGHTFFLRQDSHEKMLDCCACVRDDLIKERNTPAAEVTRAATPGDRKVAFAKKLSLMRAIAMASYVASTAAFDALYVVRKTQARVLDDDDTPLDVLKTMQAQKKRRRQEPPTRRSKRSEPSRDSGGLCGTMCVYVYVQ